MDRAYKAKPNHDYATHPIQVSIVDGKLCSYNGLVENPKADQWPYAPRIGIIGSSLVESNIEMVKFLLRQESRPELSETKAEFEAIFDKLPKAAEMLAKRLKQHFLFHGYDIGKIRVYMVGGRTHFTVKDGKVVQQPLEKDSDIDLMVAVERPIQNIEYARKLVKGCVVSDHEGADPAIEKNMKLLGLMPTNPVVFFEGEKKPRQDKPRRFTLLYISGALGISDRFQVIGIGVPFPEKINSPGNYLLVGYAD